MAAEITIKTNGYFNIEYSGGVLNGPEDLCRHVYEGVKADRHKNYPDYLKNGFPDNARLPEKLRVSLEGAHGPREQAERVLQVVLPAIAACPRTPLPDLEWGDGVPMDRGLDGRGREANPDPESPDSPFMKEMREKLAEHYDPSKITVADLRDIARELDSLYSAGTPLFEGMIRKAEGKKYGRHGYTGYQEAIYGAGSDEGLSELLGQPMPPRISLRELRYQPYYSRELENWYLNDPNRRFWTPLRAQMIGERLNEERHLRKIQKQSTLTDEDYLLYYAMNPIGVALEEVRNTVTDVRKSIVFLLAGAAGRTVTNSFYEAFPVGFAALKAMGEVLGFWTNQILSKSASDGLKHVGDMSKEEYKGGRN